jgi:DNA-directed RNA polymerase specialized sigma24 family protein
MDDEALIAAYYTGDNEAMQTLYERHHAHLIGLFVNGGLPPHRAEEEAQGVWVRVMNTHHHLWGCTAAPFNPTGGASFRTWLFVIAGHLLQDALEHLGHDPMQMPVRPEGEETATSSSAVCTRQPRSPRVEAGLVTEEVREAIRASMNELPHNQRIALALELARLEMEPRPKQSLWATQHGFTSPAYTTALHHARAQMSELMQFVL